jgi:acyl-coenzyme A thioesterase PaaI-like protein
VTEKAFQDQFPENLSYCYGCGRLNEHGLRIKSYWDGDEGVCVFQPKPYHIAVPGYVYGGLIACLIDCHSACTAAAHVCRTEGRPIGSDPVVVMLTASLHVDYLSPTPLGLPLEVRASVVEVKGRKIIMSARLLVEGEVCAQGQVVTVQAPDRLLSP